MANAWKRTARKLEDLYGVLVDYDEEFFICPECGEPIYREDWCAEDFKWECPICNFVWEV